MISIDTIQITVPHIYYEKNIFIGNTATLVIVPELVFFQQEIHLDAGARSVFSIVFFFIYCNAIY